MIRPSDERGFRNAQSRRLRSSVCCSVYPAVRNSYRALLRSSSNSDPSDSPFRAIYHLISFNFRNMQWNSETVINDNKQNKIGWCRWAVDMPTQSICLLSHWCLASTSCYFFKQQTDTLISPDLIPYDLPTWQSSLFVWNDLAIIKQSLMILTQVHLRKPCYDFYFL